MAVGNAEAAARGGRGRFWASFSLSSASGLDQLLTSLGLVVVVVVPAAFAFDL